MFCIDYGQKFGIDFWIICVRSLAIDGKMIAIQSIVVDFSQVLLLPNKNPPKEVFCFAMTGQNVLKCFFSSFFSRTDSNSYRKLFYKSGNHKMIR